MFGALEKLGSSEGQQKAPPFHSVSQMIPEDAGTTGTQQPVPPENDLPGPTPRPAPQQPTQHFQPLQPRFDTHVTYAPRSEPVAEAVGWDFFSRRGQPQVDTTNIYRQQQAVKANAERSRIRSIWDVRPGESLSEWMRRHNIIAYDQSVTGEARQQYERVREAQDREKESIVELGLEPPSPESDQLPIRERTETEKINEPKEASPEPTLETPEELKETIAETEKNIGRELTLPERIRVGMIDANVRTRAKKAPEKTQTRLASRAATAYVRELERSGSDQAARQATEREMGQANIVTKSIAKAESAVQSIFDAFNIDIAVGRFRENIDKPLKTFSNPLQIVQKKTPKGVEAPESQMIAEDAPIKLFSDPLGANRAPVIESDPIEAENRPPRIVSATIEPEVIEDPAVATIDLFSNPLNFEIPAEAEDIDSDDEFGKLLPPPQSVEVTEAEADKYGELLPPPIDKAEAQRAAEQQKQQQMTQERIKLQRTIASRENDIRRLEHEIRMATIGPVAGSDLTADRRVQEARKQIDQLKLQVADLRGKLPSLSTAQR